MATNLILLDIGNSAVTYGHYQGGRMAKFGSCHHQDIPKLLPKWLKKGGEGQSYVIISSVVPKITQKCLQVARAFSQVPVWVVGRNLSIPLKHKYKSLKQLGADRQVNLYGALQIYRPPFLVIDIGTATTVDYVSAKGVFEGGMIIPGPETAFQALLSRTALLPKSMRFPKKRGSFFGRNTQACLVAGILEGHGAMLEELIRRARHQYGKGLRVIATGGLAQTLKPLVPALGTVDPHLTLKGLLLAYKRRKPGYEPK